MPRVPDLHLQYTCMLFSGYLSVMFRWLLAWTIFNVIVQLNPISHQQQINIPLIIRNKIPKQCQCFSNHKLSMLSQHLCQVKSGRNLAIIMSHEFEARHMPKHPRKEQKTTLEGEFVIPWKFCAST